MSVETTARPVESGDPPPLRPMELARWAWRQLTSMRTALLLLLLLALASVPGSVVPQTSIDPLAVARWKQQHPDLTPYYERLELFTVYDSVWFSAIYILLMVSLVGCIVPRLRVYWRALRAQPPRTPTNLSRLPSYTRLDSDDPTAVVLERARAELRGRRFRVALREDSVGAERGHLREAGNLLFHVSVVLVLVGFAFGQLYGYKGGALILEGRGFANGLQQYDDFDPGSLFDPADLPPVSLTVDDFEAKYLTTGPGFGQAESFSAELTYRETPAAEPETHDLRVNHPLVLDGMSVFLIGHGYAPNFTVRDGNGDVAFSGPAVFRPEDPTLSSFGVVNVTEARPEQLGLEGLFLPAYSFTMETGPISAFPAPTNPRVSLSAWHGDLGLDDGEPQSVYSLDTKGLTKFQGEDGKDLRLDMRIGDTIELPDGLGSVTFDGYTDWVQLQISHKPGKGLALLGVVLALLGLMGSLFVRPRRVWARVREREGRTLVEVGGLDRSSAGEGLDDEVQQIAARIAGGTT